MIVEMGNNLMSASVREVILISIIQVILHFINLLIKEQERGSRFIRALC
jgi:hypothetical protein